MEGETISHYRILTTLGEGGMGRVYLASDTQLGRRVALKVLADHLAQAPEYLTRFRVEAKAAAALNHPNVAALYTAEEAEGRVFLTMEYVEGKALSDSIPKGGMALDRFFALALPLADALSRAHERGIVHRDFKPGNVLVTPDGVPKILDFGLARFEKGSRGPEVSSALTPSGPLTGEGAILGTVAYMSPEQLEGPAVDARSDVFSFGIVMYEMLTSRRPFSGASFVSLASSIIRDEPLPLAAVRPELPRSLTRVVERCLRKDLRRRYQSILDVLNDLEDVKSDVASGASRPDLAPSPRSLWLAVVAGALGTALLAWGLFWSLGERPPRAEGSTTLVHLTRQAGLEDEPSWSPEGRSLAYASDEGGHLGIFMRQLSGERALRIGRPDVDEAQPAWSPDGDHIAFVSTRNHGGRFGIFLGSRAIEFYVYGQNGDLFVMPALGGTARKVADHAYDPSWSPDGKRLAFRSIRDGAWRLYTSSLDNGQLRVVEGVSPRALGPAWSPDGRFLAYVGSVSNALGWEVNVVPAGGGTPVPLTHDRASVALRPAWSRDGRFVIFSSNRAGPLNLWRVAFQADPMGADGAPERLTTGEGEDVSVSVSPDGASLAYATVRTAPNVWTLDLESAALVPLTSETTVEDYPRLSPDGSRLLYYSDRSGREEVWAMNIATKELTQVSRGGGHQNAWSPDGRRVAYATGEGLRVVDLETSAVLTIAPELSAAYPAFSRNRERIAFQGFGGEGYALYLAPANGGPATRVSTPEGDPGNPSWSPGDRTLYYQLDQFGRRNIWATDLQSGESRQVTAGNTDDAHPDLSPDGAALLFLRNHKELYVVPAAGGQARLVKAFEGYHQLVEFPAWTPDGRGIVFSLARKSGDLFVLGRGLKSRRGPS